MALAKGNGTVNHTYPTTPTKYATTRRTITNMRAFADAAISAVMNAVNGRNEVAPVAMRSLKSIACGLLVWR